MSDSPDADNGTGSGDCRNEAPDRAEAQRDAEENSESRYQTDAQANPESQDRPEGQDGLEGQDGPEGQDQTGSKTGAREGAGQPFGGELPASFSSLIIGLATSAMMQMEGESPDGTKAKQDLTAAKHYIDILAELEKKTQGNLTEEEGNMLKTFLFDLRMRFVEISRRA
ncbi:MAG: DUF1844 domain-containing protein [Deltaproteobacteria bacterium]|jgi:hypothetical protein|nr:DUF1844 domain-containing protein [Deltaproteobacteria bacterium]